MYLKSLDLEYKKYDYGNFQLFFVQSKRLKKCVILKKNEFVSYFKEELNQSVNFFLHVL